MMIMTTNQKKDFLIEVVFALFVLAVVFLLYKYILPITLPFILGLLVAWIVVKITDRFHTKNKWLRAGIVILIYVIFAAVAMVVLVAFMTWIGEKIVNVPTFVQDVLIPTVRSFHKDILHPIIESLDPNIHTILSSVWNSMVSSLYSTVTTVTEVVVSNASSAIASIPAIFISILMMLVSTFFFVVDYEKIGIFYEKYMPAKVKDIVSTIREYLMNTLLIVIRSYVIICTLTFTELSILFTIFGIPYAIPLAFLIAIFDILPVLGTGGILIPWGIVAAVLGHRILGAKILFIYVIVTAIRNYVEPKIVGAQMGLHPIITLVSMFIGLQLFGFIGMFGFPIMISFFWKNRKKDEVEQIIKES